MRVSLAAPPGASVQPPGREQGQAESDHSHHTFESVQRLESVVNVTVLRVVERQ